MCARCEWEELTDKINELQDSGDYDWAADTLSGIYETVSSTGHATDNQKTAVENIDKGRRD